MPTATRGEGFGIRSRWSCGSAHDGAPGHGDGVAGGHDGEGDPSETPAPHTSPACSCSYSAGAGYHAHVVTIAESQSEERTEGRCQANL